MLKKCVILTVILISFTSIVVAGSTPNFQEGKWEVTVTTEIPGMSMQMPAQTQTQCMTKNGYIPNSSQQKNENCKVINQSVSGNKVTWEVKCNAELQNMTMKGEMTYSKTTFTGKMTTKAKGMEMVSHLKGRRIGPCK